MPVVEDKLTTAADLIQYKCPVCKEWFKDFVLFMCKECDKKRWYEIILNPEWFPKKLQDGSPDWNSIKKDKTQWSTEWSYGRLNIKTMDMERVEIDRGGKWNYLEYQINTSEEDKKIENNAMKRVNGGKKTAKEIKQEIKLEKQIEKLEIAADKQEKELTK